MEPYEIKATQQLLDRSVLEVRRDHTRVRFYTEPMDEWRFDNGHHLIELRLNQMGLQYADLIISEMSLTEMRQIRLSMNEVEELLAILLQAHVQLARTEHEAEEERARQEAHDAACPGTDHDPFLDYPDDLS